MASNKYYQRKSRKEDLFYPYIPANKYKCVWCNVPSSNIGGKLYCLQCKDSCVGQCQFCMTHYPCGSMFAGADLCISCDMKQRLQRAKKENPLPIVCQKRKRNTSSLVHIVKELESKNYQLTMDCIRLNKENQQLKVKLVFPDHSLNK